MPPRSEVHDIRPSSSRSDASWEKATGLLHCGSSVTARNVDVSRMRTRPVPCSTEPSRRPSGLMAGWTKSSLT